MGLNKYWLKAILSFALLGIAIPTLAVNKCVIRGKTVYQSDPCPNARPPSPKTANWQAFTLNNNIGKGITIKLPQHWGASNFGVPELPVPTIKIHSHRGPDTAILLSLFTLRSSGDANKTLENVLTANQKYYVDENSALVTESYTVNTADSGYGRLTAYFDSALKGKKELPEGESLYAISGGMVIDNAMIQITILTNTLASGNFRDVITGIEEMTYDKR